MRIITISRQIQTNLLVAQKHVIEGIEKIGKDCVIVGRNADVLLADKKPFRIFVCAGMEEKIRRRMERVSEGAYHLAVNTDGWDMEELALSVKEFVLRWYGR